MVCNIQAWLHIYQYDLGRRAMTAWLLRMIDIWQLQKEAPADIGIQRVTTLLSHGHFHQGLFLTCCRKQEDQVNMELLLYLDRLLYAWQIGRRQRMMFDL
jgi:hypothetical protein